MIPYKLYLAERPSSAIDTIIGLTIKDFWIDQSDNSQFGFEFVGAPDKRFYLEGDCCSTSWFSDMRGLVALRGHTVLSVEHYRGDDPEDGRGNQDSDEVYQYLVHTTGGTAELTWRNSSNGYYGGWLCEVEQAIIDRDKMHKLEKDTSYSIGWCEGKDYYGVTEV